MLKFLLLYYRNRQRIVLSIFCSYIFLVTPIFAVIDSPFRDPALMWPYPELKEDICSWFQFFPFYETARSAFNGNGRTEGLFEYSGPFNLNQVDAALIAAGIVPGSLLPSELIGFATPSRYLLDGSFETEGLAIKWQQIVGNHFSLGFTTEILHTNSRMAMIRDIDFVVPSGPGSDRELFLAKEAMLDALALEPSVWSAFMVGDTEIYARFFSAYDHAFKCRYLDAGINLGVILPAALERDINNPASIPLGGNRHWGAYCDLTLDAILKHDLRAGLWVRLLHRFGRESLMRLPVGQEPALFGAIVGEVFVKPGFTGAFSPYVLFENIRGGLGAYVSYFLVKHAHDNFYDRRAEKTPEINFGEVIQRSEWGMECISAAFFYDFSYGKCARGSEPVLTLKVDVPINFIVASNASKTYGVSLIVAVNY